MRSRYRTKTSSSSTFFVLLPTANPSSPMTLSSVAVQPIRDWLALNPTEELRGHERKDVLKQMIASNCFQGKNDKQMETLLTNQLRRLRVVVIRPQKTNKGKKKRERGAANGASASESYLAGDICEWKLSGCRHLQLNCY